VQLFSYSDDTSIDVPMEDELVHTASRPFCGDMSCPCHEDHDLLADVGEYHFAGELSDVDADRLYRGKLV